MLAQLAAVEHADLVAYGLIPEFVGRLPVLGAVDNLDKEALIRILVEPKNALLRQFKKFFHFDGVELVLTDDALDAVADLALERGTGARGLRAILEECLLEVMYDLLSRTEFEVKGSSQPRHQLGQGGAGGQGGHQGRDPLAKTQDGAFLPASRLPGQCHDLLDPAFAQRRTSALFRGGRGTRPAAWRNRLSSASARLPDGEQL